MRAGWLALSGLALAAAVSAQAPAPTPASLPAAQPRTFVELHYPAAALELHMQGTAVVRATLDATGRVTDAVGLAGLPSLTPAAVENLRHWTFTPGPASAVIAYRFEIEHGRCNDDTRGLFRLRHPNLAVVTTCWGVNRTGAPTWASDPWIEERAEAVYPPIAVSARVAGAVMLQLALDRGGRVTNVTALGGPLLLTQAAVEHARTWRLRSYRRLPRELVMVYEFALDLRDCQSPLRRFFWQGDAGVVHLDACSPTIDVSATPRPPAR